MSRCISVLWLWRAMQRSPVIIVWCMPLDVSQRTKLISWRLCPSPLHPSALPSGSCSRFLSLAVDTPLSQVFNQDITHFLFVALLWMTAVLFHPAVLGDCRASRARARLLKPCQLTNTPRHVFIYLFTCFFANNSTLWWQPYHFSPHFSTDGAKGGKAMKDSVVKMEEEEMREREREKERECWGISRWKECLEWYDS